MLICKSACASNTEVIVWHLAKSLEIVTRLSTHILQDYMISNFYIVPTVAHTLTKAGSYDCAIIKNGGTVALGNKNNIVKWFDTSMYCSQCLHKAIII